MRRRSAIRVLVAAISVGVVGAPVSAQSPTPIASTPQPFPLYGLGRIGYALPEWIRGPEPGSFVHPGRDITAADYNIVMPPPGVSLDDRVAARVTELQGDMDHATDLVASTLDVPSGKVGRVTRLVTGKPVGVEGYYLFPTCSDGTALEVSFMQPTTSDREAARATASWDTIAWLVSPCHADVRIAPAGEPLAGRPAQLDTLLRSWGHRQIGQWVAFRDLVTHGTPKNLQACLSRAMAIRDTVARIDREGRARLAALYPEPFAPPPMIVAMATAGLDVPATLDRLGDPTTRKDVQSMAIAADAGFGRWLGGMQEAIRSLGLGDANGDLTRP